MASKLCILLFTYCLSTTLILALILPLKEENPTRNDTQNIHSTTTVVPTIEQETNSTSGKHQNTSSLPSSPSQQKLNSERNRTQNTLTTTLSLDLVTEEKLSTIDIQDVNSTTRLPIYFDKMRNGTPNYIDGCPERCKCEKWEKREGLIVNCSNQHLTTIPETIPVRTIYVNLRHNLIQNITNTTFSKWNTKTVQKLNLAHNNLTSIDEDSFKYFNHIWELNLSANKLTHMKHVKLPMVHELNLEGNLIDFNVSSGFDETGFKTNRSGDCYLIYRRNTKPIDNRWTNLENVKQIMIKKKCPLKLIVQTNETIPTTMTQPNVDDVNETETLSSSNERQSMPTGPEIVFYSSVLAVFSVLMLFLVSQSYDHAWLRCLKKELSRRNTRDHIIHVHAESVRKQSHSQSKDDVGISAKWGRRSRRL